MGLLSRIFERRNLAYDDPQTWSPTTLSGTYASSGVRVGADTALTLPALYAGIRAVVEDLASLPLLTFRKIHRGRERVDDHYLRELLEESPNPYQTASQFRESMLGQAECRGDAFAEIERAGGGRPIALWPLRSDRAWPTFSRDGALFYVVEDDGRVDRKRPRQVLPARLVFHVRGFTLGGVRGVDPVTLFRETIGHALALREYGSRFFGQGSRPGGLLVHPGKPSPEKRKAIVESWEVAHQGLSQAHRTALLWEGVEWKQIGIPPEAAQYIQSEKIRVTDMARIIRIPPHKIADLERATFSNIEEQNTDYVVDSLLPRARRFERQVQHSLILPAERGTVYVRHLFHALLRGDAKTRAEAYASAIQHGWMSRNEVREREDLNPFEGGDVFLEPVNMRPAGSFQVEIPTLPAIRSYPVLRERRSPDTRFALRKAYRPLFAQAFKRLVRREKADIMREAERVFGSRQTSDFRVWLEAFYRGHEDYVRENLASVIESYGESVSAAAAAEVGRIGDLGIEQFIELYLAAAIARWVLSSRRKTFRRVEQADEGKVVESLGEMFSDWEKLRTKSAAQGEVVQMMGAMSRNVWSSSGVERLVWRTVGENCPLCSAMSGRVVGISEPFLAKGQELSAEGATAPLTPKKDIRHGPLHTGCDCDIVPE